MMHNSIISDRLPKEQKLKANRLLMSASSSSKRACNIEMHAIWLFFFFLFFIHSTRKVGNPSHSLS